MIGGMWKKNMCYIIYIYVILYIYIQYIYVCVRGRVSMYKICDIQGLPVIHTLFVIHVSSCLVVKIVNTACSCNYYCIPLRVATGGCNCPDVQKMTKNDPSIVSASNV